MAPTFAATSTAVASTSSAHVSLHARGSDAGSIFFFVIAMFVVMVLGLARCVYDIVKWWRRPQDELPVVEVQPAPPLHWKIMQRLSTSAAFRLFR